MIEVLFIRRVANHMEIREKLRGGGILVKKSGKFMKKCQKSGENEIVLQMS